MNYEAERAMNQKRLRMEGEPGHGVQGNGLPLNYMDNGHQIPYQPYAGAYNTHYPPDAFAAYGPPPPGGYAPQNLSYAPPAHQNYPHHQSFPPQQPQQLHMQSHMVQGYGDIGVHKSGWPHQPHLLPPLADTQKPLDIKHLKPEIKLEPPENQKRPLPENDMMVADLDQPKIKIKTDIFKPDDIQQHQAEIEKPHDVIPKTMEIAQTIPEQCKEDCQPNIDINVAEKPPEAVKIDGNTEINSVPNAVDTISKPVELREEEQKSFGSPEFAKSATTPTKPVTFEPKKRGRPKGSTNKPKPPGMTPPRAPTPGSHTPRFPTPMPRGATPIPRPRTGYQYAIRPFRKDFSGIQFRRRWSDDCLDSSHIPNEVYFGDVPVSMEVLFNYYDANAEREKLAAQAAQIAAQKAAAAKLAAAKLQARGIVSTEQVTTVDSSSSEESSGSSDSEESEDDQPLRKVGRPKGSKNSTTPKTPGTGTPGKRGRPPVPPELRQPGITDMKKFCKAAGIRFDYKNLTDGCTKNKERVQKMLDLLIGAGLEGKPTLEKCQLLKRAKLDKREQERLAKKESKAKKEDKEKEVFSEHETGSVSRRMTRGATGVKPRQRIVISSDEEDDTPAARRTLSKLRSSVNDEDDSD